ncbi:MAG: hypothetical protein V1774_01390 [Candidatus Eisenbacteria bacterium]
MEFLKSAARVGLRPAVALLALLVATSLPGGDGLGLQAGAQGFRRPPPPSGTTVGGETFPVIEGERLAPAPGWPIWVKDFSRNVRAEKTSAIVFAGRDDSGRACFFLADDVGFLRFCRIAESADGITLGLETVDIDASLLQELGDRLHWDFEALALDPLSIPSILARDANAAGHPLDAGPATLPDGMDGFLSVEGHVRDEENRVLAVRFVHDTVARDPAPASPSAPALDSPGTGAGGGWRIISRGEAIAGEPAWQTHTGPDRGLKGLACSERFIFLGLDNLGRRGDVRVPGSLLFLYDRLHARVAAVNTATYGIYSVGALTALSDSVTVLIDHSRMCLNVLQWDYSGTGAISQCHRFPLDLPGPEGFRYGIPNVEGVAIDDRGDIWCVTDPLRDHHRATTPALPESVYIYMEVGMPMVYRFPGGPVWDAVGLAESLERR